VTDGARGQAAVAGVGRDTPASPHPHPQQHAAALAAGAKRRAEAGIYDPKRHCGFKLIRRAWKNLDPAERKKRLARVGKPCLQFKGWGTDHPGIGRCRVHGGNSTSHETAAAKEKAARAIAKLGLPAGSGSPLQLLEKAVRYADGYLEASAAVLIEKVAEHQAEKATDLVVEAARGLLVEAIRTAGRVGKEAADAHIAERRASIDEMIVGLLERVLLAGLDEIGVGGDKREAAVARMHRELVAVLPAGDELS
jgi:hypothetical protein